MADRALLSITGADLDDDATALDGVGVVDLVDGIVFVGDGLLELVLVADVALVATVVLNAGFQEFLIVEHEGSGRRSSCTSLLTSLPLTFLAFLFPSVTTATRDAAGFLVASGLLVASGVTA